MNQTNAEKASVCSPTRPPRTARAIRKELTIVSRLVASKKLGRDSHSQMQGAMQALAWALRQNAVAPRCLIVKEKSVKQFKEASDGQPR